MAKYNYITQAQLNDCVVEFFKKGSKLTFDEFFIWWINKHIPSALQESTILTPVQHAFVANVLTIFNNI
jgi:hypothetical protein